MSIELSEQIRYMMYEDEMVQKAIYLASDLHGDNFYYGHIIRVIQIGIVALDNQDFTDDEVRDLICAFALHDAPEDLDLTYFYVRDEFNERIANLTFEVKKDPETGEFPRLQSYFGYIVKLVDRLANFTSGYLRDRNPAKIAEYQSTLSHAFDTKQKKVVK